MTNNHPDSRFKAGPKPVWIERPLRRLAVTAPLRVAFALAAVLCSASVMAQAVIGPIGPRTPPSNRPANAMEAARFLTQATFGPTGNDSDPVLKYGYSGWLDRQFALPATSHRAYWEAADAAIRAVTPTVGANQEQVWESFWQQALNGPDQMRQRAVFALSQIFVISALDGAVGMNRGPWRRGWTCWATRA